MDDEILTRLHWIWRGPQLLHADFSGENRWRDLLRAEPDWAAASRLFVQLHSARKTNRLGETFELLLQALLRSHPDVSEVVANVVIASREALTGGARNSEALTGGASKPGEVDFFFSLRSDPLRFHSFEAAVKYYLFDSKVLEEEKRWIGPARKDFLFRKARRVLDVQMPRAKSDEARIALRRQIPNAELGEAFAFVRGELFCREEDQVEGQRLLDLAGIFAPVEFHSILNAEEAREAGTSERLRPLPDRWFWIAPESEALRKLSLSTGALSPPLTRAEMALLQGPTGWRRAFVAPENWADRQPGFSL